MGDRRTDSGQFYPGGKVVSQHGVAPPQIVVQWSDVQGKPQIAPLPDRYRDSDVKEKVNEIASKFATVVVAALIGWTACADITVQKKRKDQIYNYDQVVVDVSGDGVGMNTNAVRDIAREEIVTATNAVNVAMTNRYTKAETDEKISPIAAQIASLQSGKRDLTDEKCYNTMASWYSICTPNSDWFSGVWWNEQEGAWYALFNGPEGSPLSHDPDAKHLEGDVTVSFDDVTYHIVADLTNVDRSHVLARRDATTANALAKFDADGNLVADTDTEKKIAKKADEYSTNDWIFADGVIRRVYANAYVSDPGNMVVYSTDPNYDGSDQPAWDSFYTILSYPKDGPLDAVIEFTHYNLFYNITATRRRVLRTGDAATPQELTDAISTNNPAFVSAVRAIAPTTIRIYDEVRQCWWVLEMVNGVPTWTVED